MNGPGNFMELWRPMEPMLGTLPTVKLVFVDFIKDTSPWRTEVRQEAEVVTGDPQNRRKNHWQT